MQECNKKSYSTKRLAKEVLNKLINRGRLKKTARIYDCNNCFRWHITSQEIFETSEKQEINLNHEDKWKQLINK